MILLLWHDVKSLNPGLISAGIVTSAKLIANYYDSVTKYVCPSYSDVIADCPRFIQ